jgi:hypothetical protein
MSFYDCKGSPISVGSNCRFTTMNGDVMLGEISVISFVFINDENGEKKARREVLVKQNGSSENFREWIPESCIEITD